jgi:hypothetical protein
MPAVRHWHLLAQMQLEDCARVEQQRRSGFLIAARVVGGRDGEDAGQRKSGGTIQWDERKDDHADQSKKLSRGRLPELVEVVRSRRMKPNSMSCDHGHA